VAEKNGHMTGSYKVHLFEENVIECILKGDINGETVKASMQETKELADEVIAKGIAPKLLIDMHELTGQDTGARSRAKALRTFGFEKIAIYGANRTIKTIGQYIARIAGMQDYARFFKTRAQAVRWLRLKKHKELRVRRYTLQLCSILLGLIGVSALVGWQTGNMQLAALFPDLKAMNPVTALTFVTLGIGLWCLVSLKPRRALRTTIVTLVAVWTVFYGGMVSLRHLVGFDSEVDLWLFSDKIAASPLVSGRASLGTALSLVYISILLLLALSGLKKRWQLGAFRAMSLFILVTVLLVASFYIFGAIAPGQQTLPVPITSLIAIMLASATIASYMYTPKLYPIARRFWITSWRGVLVFTIIAAITGLAWQQTQANIARNAQADAEQTFEKTASAIEGRVKSYLDTLHGFKAFFESSGFVTEAEFEKYFTQSKLQENYPGFNAISFIRAVTPQTKQMLEQEMRQQASVSPGLKNFTVQNTGDASKFYILSYVAPLSTTATSYGSNIGALPGRIATFEAARDSGQPEASDVISLTTIPGSSEEGFIITIPVYSGDAEPTSVEERREKSYGFVNTVFRNNVIFNEIFKSLDGNEKIAFRITASNNHTIYLSENTLTKEELKAPWASRTIDVAGQPWTIAMYAAKDYGSTAVTTNLPYLIIGGGLVLALLSSFLIVSLSRRREEALLLASSMTEDLNNERNEAEAIRQKDEAILDSIGDAVFAVDTNEHITLFNPAAEAISGYTVREALGKHFKEVLPFIGKKDKKPSAGFVAKALKGHVTSMKQDTLLIRKDGSTIDVADSAAPIRNNEGEILGVIVVFRDVSKERQLDQAKSEFVSLASHQLRTPLSAINWYSEMLLDGDAGKLNKDQHEYMKEIFEGNQRMVELVDSLLNVSRIEVGKLKNDPRDTSMLELADSLEKEMQASIVNKQLSLTRNFTGTIPSIFADPKLLRMVIQNLLSNAVKYTPEKGAVTFTMHEATASELETAHLPNNQKYLFISVKDTGYGIPAEQQPKIFEKLFRADNVRKMDVEGTGLGLYIVKEVAKKLGGNIWFESKESVGTTFYVVIPLTTKPS